MRAMGARTADDGLVVETELGAVGGVRRRGVRSWRGIPFAASTAGAARFRAPRPASGWDGVRAAHRFGPVAPQLRRGQFIGAAPHLPRSEDCLSLNVISPEGAGPTAGLPVMVFLHGGAYSVGSSGEYPRQGELFAARHGIVYVSCNYRLGALGWLDLRAYSMPGHPIEANLGLRDQLAALEWVQRNIRRFGGDPSRVTLFGESAGGNSVTTLMTVPAAAGLFARAIAQSSPANAVYPAEVAQRWAGEYVRLLSRLVDDDDLESEAPEDAARMLRFADPAVLARATTELAVRTPDENPGTISLAPVIDGELLPWRPLDAFKEGRAHRVPLVIGTNDREGSLFEGRIDILPTTKPRIRAIFANTGKKARKRIKRQYPGLPERRPAADFAGDFTFWFPSVKLAERHARFAPTWSYRFDAAPRMARLLGLDATHGLELFALFEKFDTPVGVGLTVLGGRGMFAAVGRRMQARWAAFAAVGTPEPARSPLGRGGSDGNGGADGCLDWPPYAEPERLTLIFDRRDRIEADPRGERRIAWQRFVPHV